jgi:hypothetical protein
MAQQRIAAMRFGSVYPLYIAKVERKGRSKDDVDTVVRWLTGYDQDGVDAAVADGVDLETFFARAPRMNTDASLITGVICGVRVEEIDDPLMKRIRQLDKLVDEVARGKKMSAILRSPTPA